MVAYMVLNVYIYSYVKPMSYSDVTWPEFLSKRYDHGKILGDLWLLRIPVAQGHTTFIICIEAIHGL